MVMRFVFVAVVSYLLGSINSSIIVSKRMLGVDIREYGSKNAGMTNSLRTMGGKKTLLVIFGDVAKGGLAILFAYLLFQHDSLQMISYAKLIAGFFAVCGHVFPLYFHFRGGKGILTMASVLLFFDWRIILILFIAFVTVYLLTKYVSLASVTAAFLMPFSMYYFYRDACLTSVSIFISAGLIIMHRQNIKRLLTGTESKTILKKHKKTDNQEVSPK